MVYSPTIRNGGNHEEGSEPLADQPADARGDDEQEGPLPDPLRRKATALNWQLGSRLTVGRQALDPGDVGSNPTCPFLISRVRLAVAAANGTDGHALEDEAIERCPAGPI